MFDFRSKNVAISLYDYLIRRRQEKNQMAPMNQDNGENKQHNTSRFNFLLKKLGLATSGLVAVTAIAMLFSGDSSLQLDVHLLGNRVSLKKGESSTTSSSQCEQVALGMSLIEVGNVLGEDAEVGLLAKDKIIIWKNSKKFICIGSFEDGKLTDIYHYIPNK